MNKLVNKLRNRKGFTLVEVIVVLVILAILAAVLIPSLTGYIDKANQKAAIAECRSVYLAAQTLVSEAYGEGANTTAKLQTKLATTGYTISDVLTLAELSGNTAIITVTSNKITKVEYQNAGYRVTYTATGDSKGYAVVAGTTPLTNAWTVA